MNSISFKQKFCHEKKLICAKMKMIAQFLPAIFSPLLFTFVFFVCKRKIQWNNARAWNEKRQQLLYARLQLCNTQRGISIINPEHINTHTHKHSFRQRYICIKNNFRSTVFGHCLFSTLDSHVNNCVRAFFFHRFVPFCPCSWAERAVATPFRMRLNCKLLCS